MNTAPFYRKQQNIIIPWQHFTWIMLNTLTTKVAVIHSFIGDQL